MSHVAGICTAPIVAEVRGRRLDLAALTAGGALGLDRFESPTGRVPWSAFVPFAASARDQLGDAALEDVAARATERFVPASIRAILPRLTDSRALFLIAARWWGPWVFNGTVGVCETLPDGRLREIVRIRPEHEACPAFLTGIRGTLRAMPRLTGQADALVELDHDGREGEFLITPPPALRFRDRLFRKSKRPQPAAPLQALEPLGFDQESVLTERRSLHLVASELERERTGRGTLDRLCRLVLDRTDLDGEATLRAIVELLLEHDEVIGARLEWRGPSEDDAREAAGGHCEGLADREAILRIAEREIGRLGLWAALEGDDLRSMEPLERWLAFALEFQRLRASNADLRRLLAENVVDWQGMERRLEAIVERIEPDRARADRDPEHKRDAPATPPRL